MLYFKVNENLDVVEISDVMPLILNTSEGWAFWHRQIDGTTRPGWLNRNDIGTFEKAQRIAAGASKLTGKLYVATDDGAHVAPRFDVIEAPAVGNEVSYSFNGDTYPDGSIVRISESLRVVTTSTGKRYYRQGLSGAWTRKAWSLVPGHRYEQNPHF